MNREPLFVFFIVLFLSLFLFGNVLSAGYILDDHSVIENRPELRTLPALYKSFLMPWHQNQPEQGNYRPLTMLTYAFSLVFSENTAFMRMINLLLHAANTAMIFYLVRRYFPRQAAYFVAFGFAFLPINAGTVVSLVGRSDLLSVFFIFLSLILFFSKKYWRSAVSFFFALLAKEFSVFLLPSVFLLSIFVNKDRLNKALKITAYYFLVLIPYFALRYLTLGTQAFKSQSSVDPIIGPLAFVGLKERILSGFAYFYLYVRKTFFPFDLSPDYSFNQIPAPGILSVDLIAGLALFSVIVWVFFKNKNNYIKEALILFLVPFGLISNMFLVTTGTFAERWWYLPSFGLLWLAVALGLKVARHSSQFAVRGLLLVVMGFYVFTSFSQARVWTDERRLLMSAAENSPNSAWARANLAAVYFKEKKFELAKKEVKQALEIAENYPVALNVHAKLLWQEGKFGDAEQAFVLALEHDINKRNHRDLYRSLSFLSIESGNYDKASEYINQTLSNKAYGDIEKTVYLDSLSAIYINGLMAGDPAILSEQENRIVENLIEHIKGL